VDGSTLFLSYNSIDRPSVVAVQSLLEARGIRTFLDRDQLSPGLPWPVALEEGMRGARAVVIFIGRELGGWQKREMWFALDRQVREEKQNRRFPVIPVLLAGADLTPSFLFLNTWIDLRSGPDSGALAEPLDAFEHAINAASQAPGASAQRLAAVCPYRGLEAFVEEHAAFFAGRTAFASELFKFTLGKNLVVVVGPSGSGKSSVVQAGLVPLLRRQLPPATTWDVATFTPGTDPFLRLASALTPLLEQYLSETDRLTEAQKLGDRMAGGEIQCESVIDRVLEKSNGTGRLLLVADQFEELFTLAPEPKRRPFARALLGALGKARFTLLITLRADFYSQIITVDRELSDLLAPAQVNIGALTRDELRESITGPASLVGLEFEVGLVDRILHDVGSEPGNLPLLEFALTGLWSKRAGRTLTNAAYDEIGGVTGALAQRAEEEFSRFAPAEQTAVRRLLSRLVRVARPEEGAEDTRQRIQLQATDPLAEKVAQALARPDVRLLVMGRLGGDGQTKGIAVEVAHEALIRNWKRLRGWLNEDREFLLWRQRTQIQVEQWEQHGRDASYLLRGMSLVEAERWLVGRPQDLTAPEQQFIQESIGLREREREEEELLRQTQALADAQRLRADAEAKSAKNLRRAVFSLAVAFVLALAAGGVASFAWRFAQKSARAAELAQRQAEKNASDAREIARKTSVYVWDAQARYAELASRAQREGNTSLAEYNNQQSAAARAVASLNEEFVSRGGVSKPVSTAQQTGSLLPGSPVKHLIVLMLENRSFDHMLGALKVMNPQIDGLTGSESNPDTTGSAVKVQPLADYQGQLQPDPDHYFLGVDLQIFGGDTRPGRVARMQGFVRSYFDQSRNVAHSQKIMYYFRPDKLPVLANLAAQFAVCDHWFSSVPGPTVPNLAFADYGTSFGQVGMNGFFVREPYKSIFERMAENGRTAKIYRYEAASSTLEKVSLMQHHPELFATFEKFLADAKKGDLPDYSFVEPNYNDHQGPDGFIPANDEHPDHSVQMGEQFIAMVYNALRENETLWLGSVLVITYSNHGGIYDHVPPPVATPDGFVAPPDQTGTGRPFVFDRLGVRVPAVIVSPYIPKGTVDHTIYEHASIPATVSKLFLKGQQTVSPRERDANAFDRVLTLPTPRSDADTPIFKFD
jgi:phospholipase C